MEDKYINNINFDDYFEKHSPGYVIDIYNNGSRQEYVLGDRITNPNKEKATSETLYDIASLTKMFTGVLTYMAYEEGKIKLEDTIYSIDDNFINLKEVKIIDLLSHNQNIWTNGYLGSVNDKEEFYNILYSAYVKDNNPTYVDTHYIILAVVLEKIYNMSYEELCKTKIFNVLNMRNTTFNPDSNLCASNNFEHTSDKVIDDIYPGLIHDTKGRVAKRYGLNLGHASIFTTGKDMLTFLETFFNNKLLKKETIDFMLSHRNTNEDNYKKIVSLTNEKDVNKAYYELKKQDNSFSVPRTYNNMGTRYRNIIDSLNDVPNAASDNTISFSGYTCPMFSMDFDNKVIVLIMCNIIHNSKLNREERKALTVEIMNKIFDNILGK